MECLERGLVFAQLEVGLGERLDQLLAFVGALVEPFKDVEQLLDYISREHGILSIGQIALADSRDDFEQVVLLAGDLNALGKIGNSFVHLRCLCDFLAQLG